MNQKKGMLKRKLSVKSAKRMDGGSQRSSVGTAPTTYKLFDFLSRKGHLLPLQVIVRSKGKGESSNDKSKTISVDQKINLLFLKHTKVAEIMDPVTRTTYTLPFNSSMKVGLIYDPDPDDECASPYMRLEHASDVIKLLKLPVIVAAMASSAGGPPENSVSEGEVLFIKGTMMGGRGKQLHVVNTTDDEKCLPGKCLGGFSTDPRHTRLHLPVLFSQEFPLQIYSILYSSNREVSRSLPSSMVNAPMLLEAVRGETSVIATAGDIFNIIAGEITHHHAIFKLQILF